jgi:hypothetical protein
MSALLLFNVIQIYVYVIVIVVFLQITREGCTGTGAKRAMAPYTIFRGSEYMHVGVYRKEVSERTRIYEKLY